MATKEQNAAMAEMMGEHIISYEASGLNVREYCKNNNLSIHRFNYWHYKRKKRQASSKDKGFSRVEPRMAGTSSSRPSSRQPAVEVTLPNGNRVAFFEASSMDLFKALL
ncbi:MAG: IS66 family insertion sequence element accessory protein TnpA [Candidatus Saccharimonadales bacterium]